MMKRIIVIAMAATFGLAVAGCTEREKRVTGYGTGGAAIGALAGGALSKHHRGRGALAGAAIGAVAGTLVGTAATRDGVRYCNYRDQYGRIYEARCN